MTKPSILGLITARGGSKGIPGKNIKELLGKPLIAYTIESALNSAALDRLILSTDDDAIASVARHYGCEVPFMRPPELATDTAGHIGVVQHALQWLQETEGYRPDYVMILQPTSPARQAFHIAEAVKLMAEDPEAESLLSVAQVPDPFNSAKTMREEGKYLRLISGEPIYKRIARRQDLPVEYYSAGLIFIAKTEVVLDTENPNLYGEKTIGYPIENKYLVDINEPEDWVIAERALNNL